MHVCNKYVTKVPEVAWVKMIIAELYHRMGTKAIYVVYKRKLPKFLKLREFNIIL